MAPLNNNTLLFYSGYSGLVGWYRNHGICWGPSVLGSSTQLGRKWKNNLKISVTQNL